MRLLQRILTVVGALALLGASLSPGSGYGNDYVDTSSVTILPGPLTAFLTWDSDNQQPEAAGQDGCFILRVLDERGSVTGWNVSMSTVDSSGSGNQPGADQLALSPGRVTTVRGNPDLAGHATFRVDPVRTNPSLLWSVPYNSGDGEYDLPLTSTPGLRSDQHANYSYTIIVNINGIAP